MLHAKNPAVNQNAAKQAKKTAKILDLNRRVKDGKLIDEAIEEQDREVFARELHDSITEKLPESGLIKTQVLEGKAIQKVTRKNRNVLILPEEVITLLEATHREKEENRKGGERLD